MVSGRRSEGRWGWLRSSGGMAAVRSRMLMSLSAWVLRSRASWARVAMVSRRTRAVAATLAGWSAARRLMVARRVAVSSSRRARSLRVSWSTSATSPGATSGATSGPTSATSATSPGATSGATSGPTSASPATSPLAGFVIGRSLRLRERPRPLRPGGSWRFGLARRGGQGRRVPRRSAVALAARDGPGFPVVGVGAVPAGGWGGRARRPLEGSGATRP